MILLINILAFLLVLTIVVFFHELGHFYIARRAGVRVEVFSIGFGKELCGFNDKHGTRWRLAMLPLGGYVRMLGDKDPSSAPDANAIAAMSDADKSEAFYTKSLASRTAIVAAGPLANFILSIVIFTLLMMTMGQRITEPVISTVIEKSAAQNAGLQPNDRITELNGTSIERFSDIQRLLSLNTGTPVELSFLRNGKELSTTLTPILYEERTSLGEVIHIPRIGVTSDKTRHETLGPFDALIEATKTTYHLAASTLTGVGQMITGQRSADQISGPIGIARYSGESARLGLVSFLWFIGLLSVNLGLINLFPIPVLDGGHLLFYACEAVIGRPLSYKAQEMAYRLGMALVLMLMVFSLSNDIYKLF